MARTSGELQYQCQQLGLSTAGTRDQLMNRLRDYFVDRDGLRPLPQIDVMTAHNCKDMLGYDLEQPWRSKEMMQLWNNPNWVVEPKLDGVRVKAHFHSGYETNPRLDSRRRSDQDYLYSEKTENFPHLRILDSNRFVSTLKGRLDISRELNDTILDGELMPPSGVTKIWNGAMWIEGLQIVTSLWNSGQDQSLNLQEYCYHDDKQIGSESWVVTVPEKGYWLDACKRERGCLLHYHIFDVIRFQGESMYESPYYVRRQILEDVFALLHNVNPYYHVVPAWYLENGWCEDGMLEWDDPELGRLGEFEQLVERGGEGVMFKHKLSPYEFGKRAKTWLKLKRFETIDAVVMGSVNSTKGKAWEGMIGAFMLGLYQAGELIHVASCSAMDLATRRDASNPDGTLNGSYLGRVAEVRMQCLTSRSMRGRHAVLIRWRTDKNPDECTMDQLKAAPNEMYSEES